MSFKWTADDVELLRLKYETMGTNIPELGCKFGARSIQAKARRLGLCCDRSTIGLTWSKADVQLLLDMYPTCGSNIPELILRHSRRCIQAKARSMGIGTCVRSVGTAWTSDEIDILKEKYATFGYKIPELLMRHSAASISAEASKLGIRRYKVRDEQQAKWDDLTIAILMDKYPSCGTNIPELLESYTREQIRNAAHRYGVKARDIKVPSVAHSVERCGWTDEDICLLRKMYPSYGTDIPELLKTHSAESIRSKAKTLGLRCRVTNVAYTLGWNFVYCGVCKKMFLVRDMDLEHFSHVWHGDIMPVPSGWRY